MLGPFYEAPNSFPLMRLLLANIKAPAIMRPLQKLVAELANLFPNSSKKFELMYRTAKKRRLLDLWSGSAGICHQRSILPNAVVLF